MENFKYSGEELSVFSNATTWKTYWFEKIKKYIGENILEIGAGIGATVDLLDGKSYKTLAVVEPDQTFCRIIQKNIRKKPTADKISVRQGTAEVLTEEEFFDTVLYIDVLEHIEDDHAELLRIQRHVRPKGNVIVVSPAHQWLYTSFDNKIGHFRRYGAKTLLAAVPQGLTVKKIAYLDSVGLLASLANKLLLKSGNPNKTQILFWDRVLVRCSRFIDPLLGYKCGKTILCVLEKST